jgi:hypothetical protein
MSIPNFQSEEHQHEFEDLFEYKASTYIKMMDKVKDMMYGSSTTYNNLPGACQEVLRDITQSLIYDTEYAFKDAHPEYKNNEDELFIPYRSFKENVLEALNEALTPYELQWKNECDTLACADHLTDE